MPYTAETPPRPSTSDELRARIPGWGVDLDPSDRPSVPRLLEPPAPIAPWHLPQDQPEAWPRERSIEHGRLPPVFGTSCPPKLLSGALRRLSYRRFSEARAAHWLLLLAADRVDAVESHLRSFATLRPDNPVTQAGLRAELTGHGLTSRLRRGRADVIHHPLDPVLAAGPWIGAGALVVVGVRKALPLIRRP